MYLKTESAKSFVEGMANNSEKGKSLKWDMRGCSKWITETHLVIL
jgi:hypothetical protein